MAARGAARGVDSPTDRGRRDGESFNLDFHSIRTMASIRAWNDFTPG